MTVPSRRAVVLAEDGKVGAGVFGQHGAVVDDVGTKSQRSLRLGPVISRADLVNAVCVALPQFSMDQDAPRASPRPFHGRQTAFTCAIFSSGLVRMKAPVFLDKAVDLGIVECGEVHGEAPSRHRWGPGPRRRP